MPDTCGKAEADDTDRLTMTSSESARNGYFLAALAALRWSTMGILGKLLFAYQTPPLTVVAWHATLVVLFGGWVYMSALSRIEASQASITTTLEPVGATFLAWFFFRSWCFRLFSALFTLFQNSLPPKLSQIYSRVEFQTAV